MPFRGPLPRIAVSNAGTGIGPHSLVSVARSLGFDGVDFVNRRALPRGREHEVCRVPTGPGVECSIWLPSTSAAQQRLGRPDPSIQGSGRRIILRLPGDPSHLQEEKTTIRRLVSLCSRDESADLVTLAIPASVRHRGRLHLHRIRRVRAIAEEWDLGIALDFVDAIDREWEAEAAVALLHDRLAYLRFRVPWRHPGTGDDAGVIARTLRTCVDVGFDGTVALAPGLPYWLWWSEAALAKRAHHARLLVAEFFPGSSSVPQRARFEEESSRS